jgi:hypothetical protein
MKTLFFTLINVLLLLNIANADDTTFMPPSTWGIPEDDHYNTYKEDNDHPCHIGWLGLNDPFMCNESTGYSSDGYVLRDCGYGGQCSYSKTWMHHAGIDYDFPYHEHDLKDYKDGNRKETGLRQGRHSTESMYHAGHDDIIASNSGEVVFAESDISKTHGFGRVVVIRHSLCSSDLSDSQKQKLCNNDGSCIVYSKYAHMREIVVKKGDLVNRGQKIGVIGGTGKKEDSWIHHLHFELTVALGPDDNLLRAPFCSVKGTDGVELAYGYVDVFPNECGYLAPKTFLNKVSVCDNGNNDDNKNDPSDTTDPFIGNNGGGSGGSTPPTEPPASGKLPDFITSKVTMGNKSGNKEKYTWKINETAYVHAWIDNIGDADWEGSAEKIKVPFYLSKGSKEDRHSEWKRIAREQITKKNLKRNKPPKHEYIKFKLQDWANDGTIMPGRTYNFVVCADRPKDQNNGDGDVKEKHKSNNCSTEAVFYVDYGPPRNVDLMADMLALTGGRTQLQAGEKYGLQVEVSNIGTEQPWNGFLTSYEIKGPSTGGTWQKIGEDTSRASSLYPNATHFEAMDGDSEVNAPMVGGDYVFRACADYTQAVPETDESNNCTPELNVYVAPPPMPDLITEGLQLTHGRTSLIAGELYGLAVAIRNIGDATPSKNIRTSYEIKGPGTGGAWQLVADDGSDADQLYPGAAQWEEITDEHGAHIPNVAGTYTARACADYHGSVPESDENNNCSEMTFEVHPVPAGSPTITVTNPTHDDEWRSDERKHIEWTSENFSSKERVKIEYSLDGGKTWDLVDDTAVNDGGKYWDMCDSHTIDTDHAYIRITSLKYPYVYDDSDEFTIDHAKGCE